MMRTLVVLSVVSRCCWLPAPIEVCRRGGNATPSAAAPASSAVPPAVDGWREYPLRDGVISIEPAKWRTDTVEVPVPAGKGLEYKLTMQAGDTLVYSIGFGALADPGQMISEFHGHTRQVDGVGDLMFYAKTGGSPQSGASPRLGTGSTGGISRTTARLMSS